jgi:hypothetical protein
MWTRFLDWAVKKRTGLSTNQINSLCIRSSAMCKAFIDGDARRMRTQRFLIGSIIRYHSPEVYDMYFKRHDKAA